MVPGTTDARAVTAVQWKGRLPHSGRCDEVQGNRRRDLEVTMRAVALTAPGHVEIVDDWPEPECGPDDVVVQIRGVGLCGSDLSVFDGKREVPGLPWVFGHEG